MGKPAQTQFDAAKTQRVAGAIARDPFLRAASSQFRYAREPYTRFANLLTEDGVAETPDGIAYVDPSLDKRKLDAVIRRLAR